MITLKARYDGRVLIPEGPVDLPVGVPLEIAVNPAPAEGSGQSTLARLAAIAREFPENPDLPEDLAAQHDHYLYGTPKRP
jgi:hypothetical protein